jgi:hypothetical protein
VESDDELEQAVRLAAADPAARPDFYARLMRSTVFVITPEVPAEERSHTAEAGEKVAIVHWQKTDGTAYIPFFSSVDSLSRSINEVSGYLGVPAPALFEMTRGAHLALNPGGYGKEFTPAEVEGLLTNGLPGPVETHVVERETKVLLGQPAIYPTDMVSAVKSFLATRPKVKAAYLGWMLDPSRDKDPGLVVGIDVDGDDVARLMQEIGVVAGDAAKARVDLIRVLRGETGLSQYFLDDVRPFYERKLGGLKGLFSFGRA